MNCTRCPCGQEDVVHISRSRVDHESKCPVYPARPLRARGRVLRTGSQDELGGPEGERIVRGSAEGCLPDPQSSCPAILRLIGTSTPITPHQRLGAEAEWTHGQAALSDASSSQSLSGFCGISGLSCFGESSLKRLLDLAEVQTVGVGEGEAGSPSSRQETSAQLLGLSHPLSLAIQTAETVGRQADQHGPSELPSPLDSGQQQPQRPEQPAGHATLPEVLLHEARHQPPMAPSDRTDAEGDGDAEEEEWAVAPGGQEGDGQEEEEEEDVAPQPPRQTRSAAESQLSKREKNRLKSQRRKLRRRERWLRSQLEQNQSVRPHRNQKWFMMRKTDHAEPVYILSVL